MIRSANFLKYLFVSLWLILTVSLAVWWTVFNTQLIDRIVELSGLQSVELAAQKNMLLWEGATWLILLISGAITIIYFMRAEQVQRLGLQKFVASFSHDLKTSLASLRLQAESLQEDLSGHSEFVKNPLMERLLADTVRLELQLDNSLFLAKGQVKNLLIEDILLSRVIDSLKPHWPDLKVQLSGDGVIQADIRAVESVLKNILHNAVVHGGATQVHVNVDVSNTNKVKVNISSNGSGFTGDLNSLGKMFYRHNPSSGSGVGLHIVRENMNHLGGDVRFNVSDNKSFTVELGFRGQQP